MPDGIPVFWVVVCNHMYTHACCAGGGGKPTHGEAVVTTCKQGRNSSADTALRRGCSTVGRWGPGGAPEKEKQILT